MKLMQRIDRSFSLRLGCFFLFSLAFQLLVSVFNTPLNGYYGFDSAFFLLIGKGIAAGKLPYLDLYDQKGPLIFYINALGYWLGGSRWGVFALQLLFFAASLLALYAMLRPLMDLKGVWLCIGFFLLLYVGTVKDGDMTEEWSLLFSLLPMGLGLRFLLSGRPEREHPLGYSLVYGLCAGVLALFRLTNASLAAGLILGFAILLLQKKELSALGKNALSVLLGVVLAIGPWCLYFQRVGAFDEFLYASLTHNFHYAVDGAAAKSLWDWASILSSVFLPVFTALMTPWLRKRCPFDSRLLLPAACISLTGSLAMTLGYGYRHYFLIIVPIITLDLALWLACLAQWKEKSASIRRWAAIFLALLTLLPYGPQMVRQGGKIVLYNFCHSLDGDKANYEALSRYIPRGSESVWGYDVLARSYLYLDVLPCHRYFAEQKWMMKTNPRIREEIDEFLRVSPPEWIFLASNEAEMIRRLTDMGYALPEHFNMDSVYYPLHYST